MDKIFLIIRRNRDYFINNEYKRVIIDRNPLLRKNICSWNLFFRFPHLEFRRRLSQIASISYAQNTFDRIYLWGEYPEIENKEEVIAVPVDEDDWISKDLANTIRETDFEGKKAMMWDVINISQTGRIFKEIRHLCRSCSYAVKTPCNRRHMVVNTTMSHKMRKIKRISKELAVKVDNISSRTFLGGKSFDSLMKIVKDRIVVNPANLSEEYSYRVELYNQLLLELYDSCKV